MFKFKLLLWVFTLLLKKEARTNPACAKYVAGKKLTFQIRTSSGIGRYFVIDEGSIRSFAGLSKQAQFTLTFKDAAKGFAILSAKDSKAAFLRGVGSGDLVITGDFLEMTWFQGLSEFLQAPKVISPYDRTIFSVHWR